jgi:hypothetical protein
VSIAVRPPPSILSSVLLSKDLCRQERNVDILPFSFFAVLRTRAQFIYLLVCFTFTCTPLPVLFLFSLLRYPIASNAIGFALPTYSNPPDCLPCMYHPPMPVLSGLCNRE